MKNTFCVWKVFGTQIFRLILLLVALFAHLFFTQLDMKGGKNILWAGNVPEIYRGTLKSLSVCVCARMSMCVYVCVFSHSEQEILGVPRMRT